MMLKVLLVFAAVCACSIEADYGEKNTPCPCGWQNILNGCYQFVKSTVSWDTARKTCQSRGGDLVIPKSTSQCDSLSNHAAQSGVLAPWIGIFRRRHDGKFYDTCGEALSFARWAANEPNDYKDLHESCGHLYAAGTQKGKWNDANCANSIRGFICQIKTPRCD